MKDKIALFDLDGTLCDYYNTLLNHMAMLASPGEEVVHPDYKKDPLYIRARVDLIRKSSTWWANLPILQLGFDIWEETDRRGFRHMILTQGPKYNPSSWKGKKLWIDRNLGTDTDITITRDKSLVYGKVLVDDYPGYIEGWLDHRPRGLVVMPANHKNKDFKHCQVVRYDGSNLPEVQERLEVFDET